MPSVASLPRELVHVLARFDPCAVAFLVRADRSLWARFFNDPHAWIEVANKARASKNGLAVLMKHAASVLTKMPALDVVFPTPLLQINFTKRANPPPEPVFAVSNDGTLLACIANDSKEFRVVDIATMREKALLCVQAVVGKLSISPSNAYIVAAGRTVTNRFWVFDCAKKWSKRVFAVDCLCPPSLSFLPGDFLVGAARSGSRLQFWNLKQGTRTRTVDMSAHWHIAAISSQFVVYQEDVYHFDAPMFVWRHAGIGQHHAARQLVQKPVIRAHCTFSPDESRLFYEGYGTVDVWDTNTFTHVQSYYLGHGVPTLKVMANGTIVALNMHDASIVALGDDQVKTQHFDFYPSFDLSHSQVTVNRQGLPGFRVYMLMQSQARYSHALWAVAFNF